MFALWKWNELFQIISTYQGKFDTLIHVVRCKMLEQISCVEFARSFHFIYDFIVA